MRSMVAAGVMFAAVALPAQAADAPPCERGPFRQFDFWLGDWEVRDASGKLAGYNRITSEQRGCVIIERWESVSGVGGMSMNYYEPQSGKWKQNWVSPGAILEMSGGMQGSSLVMEVPLQNLVKGGTSILRGTWSRLPDGRLRQYFEESKDGGKTWQEWFDGYYQQKKGTADSG